VKLSQRRFAVLLVALSATFFFAGVAQPGIVQRAIGAILVGTTLVLALWAAELAAPIVRTTAVIVVIVVIAAVVAAAVGTGATLIGIESLANAFLIGVAPAAVVIGVLRNLRERGEVTVTTVAGVLCLYLLVGLCFAFVYTGIENLGGAPFFANGDPATTPRSVYFSFVTMTTTGYGDFTARTNLGHTLSVSEALLGQIYLVTVVATIIGRLVPRAMSRS
jgi:Ion channel